MSTRGVWGLRKAGELKVTYNHSDSYPTWLGRKIITFVRDHSTKTLNDMFDSIQLVDSRAKPTPWQIDECKEYTNLEVSTGSVEEWYCLLRDAQQDFEAYANGLRYMIDSHEFMQDAVFCEWAYVIDLDGSVLVVYEGSYEQKKQVCRIELDFADIRNLDDEAIAYVCKQIEDTEGSGEMNLDEILQDYGESGDDDA